VPHHSFEEHVAAFTEQIRDLWTAGVDAIHLVYYLDSKNLRAALYGVAAIENEVGCRIPTMITFDLSRDGTILSGETAGSTLAIIARFQADRVGARHVRLWKRDLTQVT
jgi:methionine synthase I (cobalamin-dependent)